MLGIFFVLLATLLLYFGVSLIASSLVVDSRIAIVQRVMAAVVLLGFVFLVQYS